MYAGLKESKPHGTKAYPYTQYHIHKQKNPFHIPVHWHEEMEIIYIRHGRLRISIEGEVYEGMPGQIYLVNPGELHYMETDTIPVDYYTILFPLSFISFRTEDLIENEFMRPLREGSRVLIHDINSKCSVKHVGQILEKMIESNESSHGMYRLRTKALLIEMLAELVEDSCIYEPSIKKNTSVQRNMISYIQEHFADKISLEMLAEEFHMSEKYISRYFKEQFAISFTQYVSHLRMERAQDLLRNSDLSVTEISFSSGYPSVNFFIRSFKEMNQITPLQYRKHFRFS